MNLFSSVQLAPKDPIFGLTETYVADQRADKVNLGVGVYYTDKGKVPLIKGSEQGGGNRRCKTVSPKLYPNWRP